MFDTDEQGVRPTPETKAKAVEGVIGQLERRRVRGTPFLLQEHVTAAHEIEGAYRLITRPLECALSDPHRIGREPHAPEDDFTPAERRLYKAYNRWARELEDKGHSRNLWAIVIDIAVEGLALSFIERRYQLPAGQGKYRLKESLEIYCTANGRVI